MTDRVASIGECMLELSGVDPTRMTLSYGGDTLNTAVYLARAGLSVEYLTALGDDPYSDQMVDGWRQEGVGTTYVARATGRVPGLYAIKTDDRGERQFHYWRDMAPARDLPTLPEWQGIATYLQTCALVYFSGITLSIYSQQGRAILHDALTKARRAGCRIAFDTNYRPRGWNDAATARDTIGAFLPLIDIALPTLDDETALYGDTDAYQCADRLQDAGIAEVVVKLGDAGCLVAIGGERQIINIQQAHVPVDTTGAGDAFNAGYLASRHSGDRPAAAARHANHLAGETILHRGAIIPKDAMPDREPK